MYVHDKKGDLIMSKQAYKVTFRWYDSDTFCTNICIAESEDSARAEYSKYKDVTLVKASESQVELAKKKGMPIVEV